MALRIASAVSFSEPLQLITSGWEQETLFPVWKAINGVVVYPDPFKIPFSVTSYNWLFIESYAVFSGAVLSILSLEDAWLPTVGRFFTLTILLAGTALSYASFLKILKTTDLTMKILCLSFSVFVFFGPLVGFWGFTVRADIGALTFEILAVFLFWTFYPNRPLLAVLLCAVAAYAAWGFKQVNVVSTVTVGLYLLYHRDWKPLFLLGGVLVIAYASTFLIGGYDYTWGVFEGARHGYSLDRLITNTKIFTLKSAPYLAALAALALAAVTSPRFRRAWLDDERAVLVLIGLCTAGIINMLANFKVGSADHYYFSFTYFVALASVVGFSKIREEAAGAENRIQVKRVLGISMLGWAANIVAMGVVLFGLRGVVSVMPLHDLTIARKDCADRLPKPVFIGNAYLSLPWMNPGEHNFVISYNYFNERSAGLEFERGGIGGLIKDGYFASLLIDKEFKDAYDGTPLDNYRRVPGQCLNKYSAWLLVDSAK